MANNIDNYLEKRFDEIKREIDEYSKKKTQQIDEYSKKKTQQIDEYFRKKTVEFDEYCQKKFRKENAAPTTNEKDADVDFKENDGHPKNQRENK